MTRQILVRALALAIFTIVLAAGPAVAAGDGAGRGAEVDPALLAGLEARAIGPAAMSGRVVSLAGVAGDPRTLFVGSASGGLWRSTDGAVTWEPLFDEQPVASIGAIAIDPTAPDVVWVGTGEPTPRNSASVGDGVYKSLDGGATWTHVGREAGLDRTEKISRIVLDPRNTDTAYVCALGTTWGETPERGVYKTTDGGATWKKFLYVDPRSGCAELVIDPANPNKLFAAMWDHRRWPWSFRSGGPGSGLWVTRDGGASWSALTPEDGLPEGDLGRIGLAIAPSDPSRVYALVEAEENALYRSDDGGKSFRKTSTDDEIGNRPFYYSRLAVDPANPNRVYSAWSLVSVSDDGGKTWETLVPFNAAHPDHHALWIDPADPTFLVDGNDGGVAISRDRGKSWDFVPNLPLAQFYHVRVDDDLPYNVYGGLQDNGSWRGPSEVWERGGIRNFHWQEVGFGDGFDTSPHPEDSTTGYAMSQEGYLMRWNAVTGLRKDIRPAPPAADDDGLALRFNWNAAFAQDPFDADTIYYGSQYVHRSRDRGDSWEIISADLTTDNPAWQKQAESGGLTPDVTGAENFTTIVALAPSPVERGLLWVGTDDGRLHVTRDGGATWTSVEDNVVGVPDHTWIPQIHASRHAPGTAFAVFDNHRHFDWTPYVYRTSDYGATWRRLADGQDMRGYALAVLQDPVDPDLLFVGTELGLWASLDGGGRWFQWTHGVPTVSVMDLAFQEREGDLVLGTHGRGIFILDDVSPLRTVTAQTLAEPLHLFPIPDALQHEVSQGFSSRFAGAREFRGDNARYGATITLSLHGDGLPHPDDEEERARKKAAREAARMAAAAPERGEESEEALRRASPPPAATETAEEPGAEGAEEPGEEQEEAAGPGKDRPQVEIEVRDAAGTVIRSFEEPVHLGVNRLTWNLRHDPFREPPSDDEAPWWQPGGPEVLPGTYTVTARYGGHEASESVRVLPDPRFEVSQADREAKHAAIMEAGALQERLSQAIEHLLKVRRDLDRVTAKIRTERKAEDDDELYSAVMDEARALGKALGEAEKALWQPEGVKGIVAETDAWSDVSYAYGALASSWDVPTAAQREYLARARRATEAALAAAHALFTEKVPAFRQTVDAAGLGFFAGGTAPTPD